MEKIKQFEFNYNKKYSIGDVIYPYYNKSNKWYKQKYWIVITDVSNEGYAMKWHYCYDQEVAELYSMVIKLKQSK